MKLSRPRVVESKKGRWYISLYVTIDSGQRKRKRIYSARDIGITTSFYGNRSGNTKKEKREYFNWLLDQLKIKIQEGWKPFEDLDEDLTLELALNKAKSLIVKSGSGDKHKKNLEYWRGTLNDFFSLNIKLYKSSAEILNTTHVENFLLETCGDSNGYFNAARKNVSALFGLLVRHGLFKENPVSGIKSRKHIPVRNKAYSPEQIKPLLDYCRKSYFYLYVALVMEFSLLLRPHSEIRLITRSMINDDLTSIKIPPGYTKGGRARVLPINSMVRSLLIEMGVADYSTNINIFSASIEPFNPEYFSTQWGRFKKSALKKGLIDKSQTLYSMRHSAALHVYSLTKNIKKVQALMDHSDVKTTFAYMRSLGVDNNEIEEKDMPTLF